MLFDSCRAHTCKSSHMRLCVLFFRMVTNLILFIVYFPKSSLSHPLDSQVYLLLFTFNHCFRISYCGKRVGGNERFRGHELRIRYYVIVPAFKLNHGFSRAGVFKLWVAQSHLAAAKWHTQFLGLDDIQRLITNCDIAQCDFRIAKAGI